MAWWQQLAIVVIALYVFSFLHDIVHELRQIRQFLAMIYEKMGNRL